MPSVKRLQICIYRRTTSSQPPSTTMTCSCRVSRRFSRYGSLSYRSSTSNTSQTSRKASTVYYPTLHLEIAKYIQLVRDAGMELPFGLQRMVGPPPAPLCKPEYAAKTSSQAPPTKSVPRHTRAGSATEAPSMMAGAPHRGNTGVPKGAAPPVLPVPRF